ncbi:MAG: nucleotidyl transferase AbiEii/AbiGii toxin family protein [Ignavibacteria bacterium]|nr:nucleotidyl transferase AbiEii/AbiGii toxin family protein [Ignavibacteria bacterium]
MKELLPLSTRLSDECLKAGVSRYIIEKDYALSWVLVGISEVPRLKQHLIFKGGTCLKKCYFGSYRYSEDLDFSALGDFPKGKELESCMRQAARRSQELLVQLIGNTEITCERYQEKQPHPFNQEAFIFRAKFPYQKAPLVRVLVEVTTQEKILTSPQDKRIIHEYGEEISSKIQSYTLEEIIAEKACAILTNTKKLHERTWVRSRARDYYDLWCIFKKFDQDIKFDELPFLIKEKCALRGEAFTSSEDFFNEHYIKEVSRTWNEWLGPLVPYLPDSQIVFSELKPIFQKLFFINKGNL